MGLRRPTEAAWGFGLALVASSAWPVLAVDSWYFLLGSVLLVPFAATAFVLSLVALNRVQRGLALKPRRGLLPLALGCSAVQCVVGGAPLLAFPVALLWTLLRML